MSSFEPGSSMIPCKVCEADSSMKCGSCFKVSYCSKDCQRSDWKMHKIECKGEIPDIRDIFGMADPGVKVQMVLNNNTNNDILEIQELEANARAKHNSGDFIGSAKYWRLLINKGRKYGKLCVVALGTLGISKSYRKINLEKCQTGLSLVRKEQVTMANIIKNESDIKCRETCSDILLSLITEEGRCLIEQKKYSAATLVMESVIQIPGAKPNSMANFEYNETLSDCYFHQFHQDASKNPEKFLKQVKIVSNLFSSDPDLNFYTNVVFQRLTQCAEVLNESERYQESHEKYLECAEFLKIFGDKNEKNQFAFIQLCAVHQLLKCLIIRWNDAVKANKNMPQSFIMDINNALAFAKEIGNSIPASRNNGLNGIEIHEIKTMKSEYETQIQIENLSMKSEIRNQIESLQQIKLFIETDEFENIY